MRGKNNCKEIRKKYKCVIFDLDGTMLNTERMNMIPLQRLIKEELGIEYPYEELLKYKAYQGKKALEDIGFKNIEESYKKWVKYVNEFEEGASLYEGFNELMEELDKKGIICAVSSSKLRRQYELDFIPTGLEKYMKSVVLGDDTDKHKPDPEPLLMVKNELNLLPEECIYMGDTIFDFKATKAAGMDFALALWGASDLENIEADFNLNNPLDLLKELGM